MSEALELLASNYAQWLYYLALFSIGFLVLSVIFIPMLISRIPSDYFLEQRSIREKISRSRKSLLLIILKSVLGAILIISGAVMLILPGQGILTILAGLFILEFPGKYRLERYLVRKPVVLKSINWIRRRQDIPDIRIN